MPNSPPSRTSSPRTPDGQPGPSRWHSCHVPSFTSTFGFSSPSDSKAKDDFDSMETDNNGDPADTERGRNLCVRHERLRADYKRLRDEMDRHGDEFTESVGEEEGANLQEILSSLSSTNMPDDQVIQKTFETFAQASHQTRTLILHGLLSTCCYSQLSLLREKLGESVSARPYSLPSSQGPPCDTPNIPTAQPSPDILANTTETTVNATRARGRLVGLSSPARVDPLLVLPLELSTRVFSYLDARDLCAAAQVCRKWKEVSEDDALWKAAYERTFGVPTGRTRRPPVGSAKAHGDGADFFLVEGYRLRGGGSSVTPSNDAASLRKPPLHARSSSWKLDFRSRLSTTLNWTKGAPASSYSLRSSSNSAILSLQTDWNEGIVIAGSEDGVARLWLLRGERRADKELRSFEGHTASVRTLQFDNVKLITGSLDGSMKVWDWRTGRCVRTLTPATSRDCNDCRVPEFGPDGKYLKPSSASEGVTCLAFDNDILVNGSTEGAVRVWDLKRACVDTLRGHGGSEVTAVKIWSGSLPLLTEGKDKKLVLSASNDCMIKLWDVATKSCLRSFAWHLAPITSLAIVPVASDWLDATASGPVLISASLDNSLDVWDIDTGKCIQTLLGHTQGVVGVSTNGMRVVSASNDGMVMAWDAKGKELMSLKAGKTRPQCVQVNEEGIVCGMEGELMIWSFVG